MLILLIAEGEDLRSPLADALAAEPAARVVPARDLGSALQWLGAEPFDAVVCFLEGGTGDLELVRRIRQYRPLVPLLVITPEATVDRAVSFMRAGATDFHPRPTSAAALSALVGRAVGDSSAPGRAGKRRLAPSASHYLAGDHPRLAAVRAFAEKVARVPDAPVLITGEPGTGKSCLAHAIHALSGAGGRFVEVACANLPPTLVEAELFGNDRGAFTDRHALRPGLLETAAGGTLFLDEIGALPLDLQAKLLAFLDSGQIRRIGGSRAIPVSARIIAAASQDLQAAVAQGTFRADLLYRLEVASVHLPPLREMPEVVGQLIARFAAEVAARFHQPPPEPSPAAAAELVEYDWPGNIRELRNAVERALIFHEGGPLVVATPAHAEPTTDEAAVLMPPGLTLEEVQRRYLLAALRRSRGDYASLASRLGISRKTLWDKRRRLGLDATEHEVNRR